MAGFALLAGLASQVRALAPLEDGMLTAISPIQSGMRAVFDPVADFMANFGEAGDLRRENQALRQEIDRLNARQAGLEADAARTADLEASLGLIQDNPDLTFLPARVVVRDSSAFKDEVTIDKGSDDGLAVGMVVISAAGGATGSLVGTVEAVLPGHATVRLITDPQSDVAALIAGKAEGVIEGTVESHLELSLVPASANVNNGDLVLTSGLGGNFPIGLAIGQVVRVEGTPLDIHKQIRVQPVTQLSTIRDVLVMTSFTPTRLLTR
jgi:rod shape-determining protein MreC